MHVKLLPGSQRQSVFLTLTAHCSPIEFLDHLLLLLPSVALSGLAAVLLGGDHLDGEAVLGEDCRVHVEAFQGVL